MLRWWTITAFVGLVLLADGVHPDLGGPAGSRALRFVGLVAASILASAVLAALSARARTFYRRQVGGLGLARALLPRTPAAALRFIPVALTAGVCEELVFRGLVPYWTRHMLPAGTAYPWMPVVVSAAMFGAMHVYQGWRGVALTGALGGALVLLTAATGSLLPAIAVHVLLDLRVALLFIVWRELPETHDAATATPPPAPS